MKSHLSPRFARRPPENATRARTAAAAAFVLLVTASLAALSPQVDAAPPRSQAVTATTSSIWSARARPAVPSVVDDRTVTVGTRFKVNRAAVATDLEFFKSRRNTGVHVGSLWTLGGTRLASVRFANESAHGWQRAKLASPVMLPKNHVYVVSYVARHGHYSATRGVFSNGHTVKSGALTATGGRILAGGGFPSRRSDGTAYYADIVVKDAPGSPPPVNPPPTSTNCVGNPSGCGYPDASNTGVPNGLTLRKSGSVNADKDGQVIDGLDITGEINVTASNVVIRNTRVTGGKGAGSNDWVIIIRPGAENLTIVDSEVTTPAGSQQDAACIFNIGDTVPTVRRVDISGCSAGVSSGGGLIEDSYVHGMSEVPGLSHVVGIASNGGGGMTIRHNTVLNSFDQTAAVSFYQDFGAQRNDLVQDNLLAGGGYCVYGGAGSAPTSNIRFLDNRFSKVFSPHCGYYGVVASFHEKDPGNEWSGNYWDENLAPVGG